MPNITYPPKVCNFQMQVFQIKLKYQCSKPIKLQKFFMQQYNSKNSTLKQTCWLSRHKHTSEDPTNKQPSRPVIDYGCIVWHECNKSLSDKLERFQNQAMRVILRANRTTCTQYMRNTLGLLTLYNRRRFLRFVSIFKIVNNQNCPKQLEGYLTSRAELQNRNLRTSVQEENCWCK